MPLFARMLFFVGLFLLGACVAPRKAETTLAVKRGEFLGLGAALTESYVVTSQEKTKDGGVTVESLIAHAVSGRIIHVEKLQGLKAGVAESLIRDRLALIDSIYDPHRDPYFSVLTTKTFCPRQFQPLKRVEQSAGKPIPIRVLFANDRLTYGSCTQEQAAYRVIVAMLVCDHGAFIFENFVPAPNFAEAEIGVASQLRCP